MKLLGIALRRPDFNELTAAAVMATGLWMAAIGLLFALQAPLGRADAGALLIMVTWGCVSVRMGIRIDRGSRHVVANVLVGAVLLGLYQFGCTMAGTTWPA